MYHHQRIKYLDCPDNGDGRAEKGVCAGRKCTYTRNPHDDGRNTGRGGQEPRRNVPPLLFTLAPDDKYIRYTMEKAMYLVDETGLAQYNTLKEKGFYSNILGTSAVFSIFCDSISFDKKNMEFTYYGRQRIERRSNILMRELVTAGQLKRVPRTDNNPHGLLIVNWRTLLNKDIEQKQRVTIKSPKI